jgi:hypothetical protein
MFGRLQSGIPSLSSPMRNLIFFNNWSPLKNVKFSSLVKHIKN